MSGAGRRHARRDFGAAALLLLEPRDRVVERLHLRMLLRVLQQQLVALRLEARDLAVDRTALGRAHQAEGRFLALQLPRQLVATRLQLARKPAASAAAAQSPSRGAGSSRRRSPACSPTFCCLNVARRCSASTSFCSYSLICDSRKRCATPESDALQTETVFHERIEQRAHDLVRHLGVIVLERHLERVLRRRVRSDGRAGCVAPASR